MLREPAAAYGQSASRPPHFPAITTQVTVGRMLGSRSNIKMAKQTRELGLTGLRGWLAEMAGATDRLNLTG
jgi:hypothetical protein